MAAVVSAIAHKHTFRFKEQSILASRAGFANHRPRIRYFRWKQWEHSLCMGGGVWHLLFLLVTLYIYIYCPREARHHSSPALDSFSLCGGWPLILRSPVMLRCRSSLSSFSRAWLAPVWFPSDVEPTVKNYLLVIGLSAFIIYAVLLLTQPILCWQTSFFY